MKAEPPRTQPAHSSPSWHLLQVAAWQCKARQGHLLTFALTPGLRLGGSQETWAAVLAKACQSSVRPLGCPTERGGAVGLTWGSPARKAAQTPLICSGGGRPQRSHLAE